MPQLNIHWKGCPHRHFPRIRVASSPNGTRSLSHLATQNIVRSPFGSPLEKARLEERTKTRRERRGICRSSAKSSAKSSARRQASQKTRQDVRLCGSSNCCSAHPKSPLGPQPEDAKATEPYLSESVESLTTMASRPKNQPKDTTTSGQEGHSRYKIPPEKLTTMNIYNFQRMPLRNRTYDTRLPVKKVYRHGKSSLSSRKSHGQLRHTNTVPKLCGTSDKIVHGTIQSKRAINRSFSHLSPSTSLSSYSQMSKLPSRTPSQLKALRQFSRELERHVVAQDAICNAGLAKSSTLSSILSVHTISEFLPYQAEFQAAGLAVTSAEQRQRSAPKLLHVTVPSSAQKDGVDDGMVPSKPNGNVEVEDDAIVRGVNGRSVGATDTETTTSDTTVIPFEESHIPLPLVALPAPRRPTKKSLPWLRRAETTLESTHLVAIDCINRDKGGTTQTNSTCSTCATTIIEFTEESKKIPNGRMQINPSPTIYKPLDIRWIDMDYDTAMSGVTPTQSKALNEEPLNLQADSVRQCTIIGSKASKPRPIRATGKGRVTDVDPLVQSKFSSPDTGDKTDSLSNTNVNRRGPERRRMLSKEHTIAKSGHNSSHKTSRNIYPTSSIGNFRPSPILWDQHDRSTAKQKHAITVNDGAKREDILRTSSPSMPPACFAPLAPQSSTVRSGWNCKIPYTAVPENHYYANPLDSEQVLCHIEKGSHLSSMWSADLPADTPVFQPIGDPVKPVSTASTKSKVPSISNSQMMASDSTFSTKESKICEKDVLRGLQMAMAAACNEEVDAWISEISGYRVRRFLADLRAFEGLGVNPLVERAIRTAKVRTKECDGKAKAYERLTEYDRQKEHVMSIPRDKERARGFVAAYARGRQDLDIAESLRRRQEKASESIRERAVAMGWRERSISAGC